MLSQNQPRGIRNNNPLNIVRSSTPWVGKIPHEKATDTKFEQFESMLYGIRAAAINMRTHVNNDRKRRHRTTLVEEINRWCPDGTAETYIKVVACKANVAPGLILDFSRKNEIARILWAMSYQENGKDLPFQYFENALNTLH